MIDSENGMMGIHSRSIGLDVARSLAIGAVLLCHCAMLYSALFPDNISITVASTLLGYYGVELFFVLSGFLIGGILFSDVLPNPSLASVSRFFMRRWLRILPAYYAVLALLTVLERVHGAPVVLRWDYLLFWQNYDQGAIRFFPVSWSLTIEQWSYLLAPIVLLLLPRLFAPLTPVRQRQIWLGLLTLLGIMLLLRLGTTLQTGATWDMGIRKQIHLRLDAIFFGVLVVSCRFFKQDLYRRLASLPVFLCAVAGLFLLVRGQAVWMLLNNAPGGPDGSLFFKTIGFTLTDLLLALTLPFFAGHRFFTVMSSYSPRLGRFFANGSRYAYSLYLVHFTIFALICPWLATAQTSPVSWRILALVSGTTVALLLAFGTAAILYHGIEKPGMDARKYFTFQGKGGK